MRQFLEISAGDDEVRHTLDVFGIREEVKDSK